MSRLQIELAERMKAANRNPGDQKSRDTLLLAVLCTRKRCSVDRRASSQRTQPLGHPGEAAQPQGTAPEPASPSYLPEGATTTIMNEPGFGVGRVLPAEGRLKFRCRQIQRMSRRVEAHCSRTHRGGARRDSSISD